MRTNQLASRIARVLAVSALAFILAACNALENETDSMSQLIIVELTGLNSEGSAANYIQSDVLFEDPATGATSVIADIATATLTAQMLDPDPITGVSPYADIQLTGYHVTFTRADGKNTPGVDVPYAFEGNLSALIRVGSQTGVGFIIVREAAKMEPPLLNLLEPASRAEIFTATARVDFFGHDLSGKSVKATGYIDIEFANYGN